MEKTGDKLNVNNNLNKNISFVKLFRLFVSHWQWFLLSMVICLCAAFLYTNYVTPVYKLSGLLLIKSTDKPRFSRSSNRLFSGVKNLGTFSNTLGIENEVELLWSNTLLRDVVLQLKLYTDYKEKSWPKDHLVYADQPVSIDLDPVHLDSLDKVAYDEFRIISVRMVRQDETDSTIHVRGILYSNDEAVWTFSRRIKSLPFSIDTPFGTLTFTHNPNGKPMTVGRYLQATIYPPLYKSLNMLGRLSVAPASTDQSTLRSAIRHYNRLSSIALVKLVDQNVQRGTDIIRQLAVSYNRQATAEKKEIALHNEKFINERIALLGDKLGSIDSNIVDVKRQAGLTSLTDAAFSVRGSNSFSSQLIEAGTQIMMIDALNEYVENPANLYELIPSNIGVDDRTTVQLINQYNKMIQKRNHLLKSASEESVQVKQLTASIDEMRSAVATAIQHARSSADINRAGVKSQYAKHKSRVSSAPTAEHALQEAYREIRKRDLLYKLLLQKREENTIAMASVADQGQLIDEPLCEGRVSPNLLMAYGIATGIGIIIPYAIIFLTGLLRYKLENREELTSLTDIPIIADVPLASESDKSNAGIVVKENSNGIMDEVFRLMRINLQFMLRSDCHTILFTSNTSGEGKTFNAANLSVSYALSGKRVILCGLDIRKPALGKLFNLPNKERGISTLLAMTDVKESDVLSQIQPSGVNTHLDLLLAGPIPPNPAELLGRDTFRQVLTILKENYDFVILDTAPVGLVTDTLQFSSLADVTVYVCRCHYTPKYTIGQLNDLAMEGKLCNPCIVLNSVENQGDSHTNIMS